MTSNTRYKRYAQIRGWRRVENQSHCDFVKLRTMLIRTHLHNVKDISCDCHYENYRAQCIQTMTSKMNTDNRVESPIPILPLYTPDMETEKLIKMKDEELRTMQECYRRGSQFRSDPLGVILRQP